MNWKKTKYYFFKIFFGLLLVVYFLFVSIYAFLFIGPKPTPVAEENITWGVNFSHRQAEALGLDWKETYTALLDDLGVKYFRIPVYWDELEAEKDKYDFEKWDWQLEELKKRDGKAILALGFRLPRWPECHFPDWLEDKNQPTKDKELFQYIREVVAHYRDNPTIIMWQVENEPFLWPFGECPKPDGDLLDLEIELVRALDSSRPIMITDSGEWSTWIPSGKRADIFGSTLYRIIHDPRIGFLEYTFFTPTFHWRKGIFLRMFRPDIPIQVIELQAEPWVTTLPLSEAPLEEQYKTLDLEKFRENMNFARATGFDTFYLWGSEWWYWLKTQKDMPEIWNEAGKLFSNE